jgi:ribonuclease HII
MSVAKKGTLFDLTIHQPTDFFEKRFLSRGLRLIAGIDEAGRGPLAGPVVAAAVILPLPTFCEKLQDSKKLLPKRREVLYERILEGAVAVSTGIVAAHEIDRINIARATQEAMARAIRSLSAQPDLLLIDGITPLPLPVLQRTIVKGDSISISIAAASIVAKVCRDRIMLACHERYPQYNFAKHKGYGTREHLNAIRTHGCCEYHRKTFRGVREQSVLTPTESGA